MKKCAISDHLDSSTVNGVIQTKMHVFCSILHCKLLILFEKPFFRTEYRDKYRLIHFVKRRQRCTNYFDLRYNSTPNSMGVSKESSAATFA